ncbi:hypothetical protein ACSSVQ_000334 [Parvibaculum sp. MBR-TMA-1.3b-4.2]|jgi:hypothetical protein
MNGPSMPPGWWIAPGLIVFFALAIYLLVRWWLP